MIVMASLSISSTIIPYTLYTKYNFVQSHLARYNATPRGLGSYTPHFYCAENVLKLGPPQSIQVLLRASISIIGLMGVWIVPLKSRINLQTRLGPLLEFQRRIILARLVVADEKTRNFCQ